MIGIWEEPAPPATAGREVSRYETSWMKEADAGRAIKVATTATAGYRHFFNKGFRLSVGLGASVEYATL